MSTSTRVVKVPVRIDEDDTQLLNLKYALLREMMRETQHLANLAIRHYVALNLKDLPKEINSKTGKPIVADTFVYRILARERNLLSAGSVATLGRNFAGKLFRATNRDAWAGRKSIPTYRSAFVAVRHQGTTIEKIVANDVVVQYAIMPDGFGASWMQDEYITNGSKLSPDQVPNEKRPLRLVSIFSWKDTGAAEVVGRILSGEYKLCDSSIRDDRGTLKACLVYRMETKKAEVSEDRVCGVDLGVVIPAVCAVNDGPQRAYLGSGADVNAARSKFRAERRRQQRRLGLYTKTRGWEMSEKELRWIDTYYHALTRGVIKFCLQYGCGSIQMEDLTGLRSRQQEDEYQRLMWMPSKFQQKLEYKAKDAGIKIVKVNPRNTSRRCSKCGHIAGENRPEQSKFVCQKCGDAGKPVNADYNAARNIALASGDVIKNGYQ